MNIRELRDLLLRAAAVIDDPASETEDDRDHLVEQLCHAAEACVVND